ncbi:methyltransferase domain-containing protein [Streptomyces sp. NPDC046909]|uniref:class I SAM-dependent methyltransferase n=1 Tax=Streptomyces sp. NPDC046909 TaxID=3155617 RepID=UPI00340F2CEC
MTTQVTFEVTEAEREVADLLPVEAPVTACHEVLDTVPIWFHTFALNKRAGLYTPGLARDHRYRIPFLPADFTGLDVLDVGTCDGFYAFLAEARGAARVLAVDNEQYCHMVRGRWGIEIAGGAGFRAMKGLLGSSVDYLRANALDLVVTPKERFDFIYCCGMLHRVPNPLGMLQVLRNLLRPEGRILLETYGVPEGHEDTPAIQVLSAGEANPGDDVHYWGFGPRTLARLAEWARLTETGDTTMTTIDGHPRIIATLRAA